jgi:hypothetical protein
MSQVGGIGKVVDGNDFHIVFFLDIPEGNASDASEAINGNAYFRHI